MGIDTRTIDIKLPTRWEDLTQKQLRYLFTLIAQGYSIDEVKAFCLFRWNKITILHRYGEKGYMCSRVTLRFVSTALQVSQAFAAVDWLISLPSLLIRL